VSQTNDVNERTSSPVKTSVITVREKPPDTTVDVKAPNLKDSTITKNLGESIATSTPI
jgi:hypothetical protein